MSSPKTSVSSGQVKQTQQELLTGLQQTPKTISSKYFYDARGCELFDRICELPEYYPMRTELGIMESAAGDMAHCIGENAVLIEYGSGASIKTRLLLKALREAAAYVPLDIASEHLQETADSLRQQFPGLQVIPIQADFTQPIELPPTIPSGRRVVYFPGSTIGNLTPLDAVELLRRVAAMCPAGGLLLGIDLVKDTPTLEAAYNDAAGVTAEFNLNALRHINRVALSDFDLAAFRHRAIYNAERQRIEMHLDAVEDTQATIGGVAVAIAAGESICTELSHKYDLDTFPDLAAAAGMRVDKVWTDREKRFAVVWLQS